MKKQRTEPISELVTPVRVEILPPEAPKPRTQAEELDAKVRQHVAEMLTARDEFIFEPFFRSRQMAYEIRRLQTVPERKKWAVFFEREGCLACRKKGESYGASGFCQSCYRRVSVILKEIVSELMQQTKAGGEEAQRFRVAKSLLSDGEVEKIRKTHHRRKRWRKPAELPNDPKLLNAGKTRAK